jgi:transposase
MPRRHSATRPKAGFGLRARGELRCYVPEPVDETWGRLRHLGARRDQLIVETVAQVQQMSDLLECVCRRP